MMDGISNIPVSADRVSQGFDIVKHALETAHQMAKVQPQTAEIRIALESTDHDLCFHTAQRILKKYRKMLNSYTFLTGISIIDVTPEEAHSKGIDYWKNALRYAEMLIYADVAIQAGLKSVIEEKLKKIFFSESGATSH